ncbi:uncharacterized protein SCHCODRAFT_02311465 [Schizophyllum commune H4-8]|uniref:uncharacterized protein n=1 Tax=Schizophyllum commune (strain H4-8 / FGSC 9210) TaxID=578458 RepID=UPI00215DDCCE|nr:uncharacterized protein SCHCODRAFT_02311465 [Schizophyllum commune H4-8]KAI5891162.1 hypothetical protein SCHCODRAFT_02311465 [Schizophyllum commune H4-8]
MYCYCTCFIQKCVTVLLTTSPFLDERCPCCAAAAGSWSSESHRAKRIATDRRGKRRER